MTIYEVNDFPSRLEFLRIHSVWKMLEEAAIFSATVM